MGLASIKSGDKVIVIAGKDKGRIGKVLRVMPREGRVLIERVNMVKKHQRQTQTQQGGIVSKEAPIHISNVMLVDKKTNTPTRVGASVLSDGKKVRISKKTKEQVD